MSYFWAKRIFGGSLFTQCYAVTRPLASIFYLFKCVTDMVLVAGVSSYCELCFAVNRNFVGSYFCDFMQFPVV